MTFKFTIIPRTGVSAGGERFTFVPKRHYDEMAVCAISPVPPYISHIITLPIGERTGMLLALLNDLKDKMAEGAYLLSLPEFE